MINLLPIPEKTKVRHEYQARVAVVVLGALALEVVVGLVLMLPTYLNLRFKGQELAAGLDLIKSQDSMNQVRQLEAVIKDVNDKLSVVRAAPDPVDLSALVQVVSSARPSGIALTSFLYSEEKGVQLHLKGTADKRSSLITFVEDLKESPAVAEVQSPISNLVAEHDNKFTISILVKSQQ